MRRRNVSPLDEGTLYVARFDADGIGIVVAARRRRPCPASRHLADILIDTRGAAARRRRDPDGPPRVGRGPPRRRRSRLRHLHEQHRPNRGRRREPAGPQPVRPHPPLAEHRRRPRRRPVRVVGVRARRQRPRAQATGRRSRPADVFGSPDGLAFDADGRLWIETDGSQPVACNNQMLAADPVSGDIRRFLVGPAGCEITGWTMTPDQRTLFVNIQHPGEGRRFGDPDAQSSWPDRAGRPARPPSPSAAPTAQWSAPSSTRILSPHNAGAANGVAMYQSWPSGSRSPYSRWP